MFSGSRFCAHCGAEAVREVLAEEKPLVCPRCREPMQALRLGGTETRECSACGGLWLDPASLQRLANAREERAGVVGVLAARVPTAGAAPDVVRYIPCPRCGKLMNRVNFAQSSGVVLDVCKNDGVWLDRGELQRVLGFVEAGGLTIARERERERLVDEQRRLAAMRSDNGIGTASSDMSTFSLHARWPTEAGAPPVDLMHRLLFDALGVVSSS
jgi:Zn-finger nucleic acid-binding protein